MRKKLTKSADNVVLTGTLGGIAEYLGIDPTIVRVIYVFLSFVSMGFPTITLYIILAILIPSAGRRNKNYGHQNPYYQSNNRQSTKPNRKEAEKVDDDDWSDF